MKCFECEKETNNPIKVEPIRHLTSPNSINYGAKNESEKYYNHYCSQECRRICEKKVYQWFAELDRNASDSECFKHIRWEKGWRIGKCEITNQEVRVFPLCPSGNSGQPKECEEHFKLRRRYVV